MSEQRLIDANALLEVLEQRKRLCTGVYGDLGGAISGVIKLIDNAPTVDAIVNTIEVRPQGEWINVNDLRLMRVDECAGHSIEYAQGWKACIEWLKSGGDRKDFQQ